MEFAVQSNVIEAWTSTGNDNMANFLRKQLTDYEHRIGHLPENLCR